MKRDDTGRNERYVRLGKRRRLMEDREIVRPAGGDTGAARHVYQRRPLQQLPRGDPTSGSCALTIRGKGGNWQSSRHGPVTMGVHGAVRRATDSLNLVERNLELCPARLSFRPLHDLCAQVRRLGGTFARTLLTATVYSGCPFRTKKEDIHCNIFQRAS